MFKWCDQRIVGNYLTTVPPMYFFIIWIKYTLSLDLAIKQLFKISQIICPPQIIEYTGASLNVSQSKFNYYITKCWGEDQCLLRIKCYTSDWARIKELRATIQSETTAS